MNKGFKALPEYVQRKIDPEMAERYMGGGPVMNRPLFRQAGGPAEMMDMEAVSRGQEFLMQPEAPAGMPAGVDPRQAQMVQDYENQAMARGEQIGMEAAQTIFADIDAAEDPKSMIDALRGNEKPLEARYAELAGYVGEEDANKTPESVLAMVQPTIMMTEEGAIDSGIGELMQQLVAGVDMSEGEAMGQGVGELMAMGAGNTPPENFSQGGPVMVRRFADGTPPLGNAAVPATPVNAPPSLEDLYSQRQAMYSNILGSQAERDARLQEQQRMSKAQMLFDIAQAGLAFAGETQGRTAAERLANAASKTQLFDRLGSRAQQVQDAKTAADAEKRSMQLAALQSAERSFETAQERALKEQMQADQLASTAQLQLDRFGHETGMQSDRLTHAETLQDKQNELQKTLITLRGLEDRKSMQVRAAIEEELAFIKADLAITNDLERMEAQNFYDIEKMDKGFEQDKALASYNATLTRIRDDGQRAFTATQNAFNRALQRELQVDSQEFESELRKELKQMDLDDRAIDRQVAKVQNDILNAFRKDEALRADQSLALQELIAQNDEDWRAQQQIIDQYKATTARMKETRLADEGKSVTVPAGASVYKDGVLQFTAPKDATASTKVLGPGEILVDANGKELARGPEKPADTGKTESERLRFAITDQATLDALAGGTLEGQDLNRFYANLQAYIQPQTDIKGVTTQAEIPPDTQKVLQELQAAGKDVPINPTLYGGEIQTNDLLELSSEIMKPTVDLRQATGLLSGLKRGINWAGSQIAGETGLGKGVLFKDTAEGSAALNSLAQFTERFYIEGRTLAKEFENLQAELVRPAAMRSDSQALEKLSSQRNLLDAYDKRLEQIVRNPRSYTEAQVAKANDMKLYLSQLLGAYDTAIGIYEGGPQTSLEGKPDPSSFRR